MKSLSWIVKTYLVVGGLVSLWFIVAAANGWKAPNLGVVDSLGSSGGGGYGGRRSGGYWGGGK